MAIWNAALIIAGLLLTALAGEVYLRLANPFLATSIPFRFVDGIGLIRKPNSEIYYANWNDDNFVVSRANSQGFLDREPVNAERAAAGCHIAFIGDSYVEAKEVSIADKFHVRMEETAARELPLLNITTQAYGMSNTGQIHQLPFYDEYARRLNPKLVVLVFFYNDFSNNSTALYSLGNRMDPDRMPYMSAHRDESGALKLRPPDPDFARFAFPSQTLPPYARAWKRLTKASYFAKWLDNKNLIPINALPIPPDDYANMIAERPCYAWILDVVWRPGLKWPDRMRPFWSKHMPPDYKDALEYTAFGIEQFKRRADRDGMNLAILAATRHMGTRGDPQFDRISAIAKALDIPIISDYDYVLRQGYDDNAGQWRYDFHWNATGHQWVAEAILEWLKTNQDVCA